MNLYTNLNNSRHFDIAIAALSNVSNHNISIKIMMYILSKYSKKAKSDIPEQWYKERKSLISRGASTDSGVE